MGLLRDVNANVGEWFYKRQSGEKYTIYRDLFWTGTYRYTLGHQDIEQE